MPPTSEQERKKMAEVLYPSTIHDTDISSFPTTTSCWSHTPSFTSGGPGYSNYYVNDPTGRHGQQQYFAEPESIEDATRRRTTSYSSPPEAFLDSQITVPSQESPNQQQIHVSQSHYSQNVFPAGMEPPSVHAPASRTSYPHILPDPLGMQRIANRDLHESSRNRRRRSTATSVEPSVPPTLREDERFLLSLKDDQNLPWKEIARRFQTDLGQTHQVAALQMRYQRLKQRLRVWTETDITALRQAHDWWKSHQWEIISEKMLEFGAAEKFAKDQCKRKWQEINPTPEDFLGHYAYATHSSRSVSPAPQPPVYPPPTSYWSQFFQLPEWLEREQQPQPLPQPGRKRARTVDESSERSAKQRKI